ncbi:hypothetical protein PIIN_11299 [Serendipita indica DSM 11827]|uniref:Uncharacterized protein n=1 Tax=Serendipita indica (strain DSM 11827) TaxID=1109443 RepID=G4U179_SERID|nr:hypothetical protein PIIN_11299 [Serendipita indica DSM 11827]
MTEYSQFVNTTQYSFDTNYPSDSQDQGLTA